MRAKGPRLYPRARKGRPTVWVIRDAGTEISTECRLEDRRGAEEALAAYITAKHRPDTRSTRLGEISVANVINLYLTEHAPHVSNAEFLAHTAAPVVEWWGDKTLAHIRGATCRQYVAWRCNQGVSDQTARHDLKTLRAAVLYYHREYGPLDAVPAFTLPPKAAPRTRFLSRSEAARLLFHARHSKHTARLILIGLYTGTRRGAILGLRWVPSLTSGWIDVEHGIMHRVGARSRQTKKQQPSITLPHRLLVHARRWHRLDMAQNVGVVVHYKGRTVHDVRTSWENAREAAGLGADVVPHTLRHTCVTWMLRAGVSAWDVAGFVGLTVEMIDRVYGHHGPPQVRGERIAMQAKRSDKDRP